MLTLFWSSRSPYARKVMVAAHEKGIAGRLNVVRKDVAVLKPDEDVVAANPLGKIPTLVLPDRTGLYDSSVICEYLDGLGASQSARLLPHDGAERIKALRWQATGAGLMDVLVLGRAERSRPDGSRSDAHVEAYVRKARTTLDRLEEDAAALSLEPFSIGSLTIGCALSYADFRFADVEWRKTRPRLAQWHEGFAARPSVRATEHSDDY